MASQYEGITSQVLMDGYAVIENFLDPDECDEMIEAAMNFTTNLPGKDQRSIFSSADKSHLKDKYFIESNDKIRMFFEEKALHENGELKVDPIHSLNKVGHALHLLHPVFRCYTYSDRMKAVMRVLGFREPTVAQSMVIYKNPGVGSEVMPHQDSTFIYAEPMAVIGVWIALEKATVANGCLWVIPASHMAGAHRRLIRNPDPSSPNQLIFDKPPTVYPNESFIEVPVKKGSAVILHGDVVHKSDINMTDKSRLAYTFHVVETRNNIYPQDNWLQEGPNAPFCNMYHTPYLETLTGLPYPQGVPANSKRL